MQIVELDIRLPYEGRGKILGRLYEKVRGKIRDIHFFPPDVEGISEIRMEIVEDDAPKLLSELRKIIKKGTVTFKVLSEA
ncbi:hypothetical protein E3E35_10355 [Thermococcus sp. GR7]|uniref:hypothetical protein n=1 Tax=unclassified Thermococcus TaxID=2627626 RepID=UPI0014312F1F|nr:MULTISPECIES: hypothetical protein [unclassified Thermococcus]NJE47788.1 hypothetical protein [Thermococcus sp. GR7]NJE79150.1 hypothetical protein [Thermococcus sp. GR4]NJE85725.1 hypothetical protein [Thermococcus sp. CX2]NJF23451.1 hypothetical protein [Thermococcus sp. GR5]